HPPAPAPDPDAPPVHLRGADLPPADATPPPAAVVRLQLVGGNPQARAGGLDALTSQTNYYLGADPAGWHPGVAPYCRVRLHDVYPGVDTLYYANAAQRLEYDFVVAPGADPA